MKRVLLEALLVALVGALAAFAANALSPRGLKLTRNYGSVARTPVASGTNVLTSVQLLAARLQAKGLHLADSNRVTQLFYDPRYQQNLVIFVDARDDEHYQTGHVPGAYQFDFYHPDNFLTPVLQASQIAQEVLVYCNGGDCEDSELTATMLGDAGIPKE